MIDQAVKQNAEAFTNLHRGLAALSPILRLDGSWPSIGTVDLITFELRQDPELAVGNNLLLKGAASYIALLIERCWSALSMYVHAGESHDGIFVKAIGEPACPSGREFTLFVERALVTALKTKHEPLLIMSDYSRDVPPTYNYLSQVALGLMLGLNPASRGSWFEDREELFKEARQTIIKTLGVTCVSYYEAVFGDEPLGQVGELYLNGLIYPPATMEEGFPAYGVMEPLINELKALRASKKAVLRYALNLAQTPDELMSSVGVALYAALADPPLPREIVSAAESKGTYMAMLRLAMLKARELWGLRSDWLFQEAYADEDGARIEIEAALGFFPYSKLSVKRLKSVSKDQNLRDLVLSISVLDEDESLRLLDKMLDEAPADMELQLQRAYVDLYHSRPEKAEARLRVLLSEPGIETNAMFLNLLALSLLVLGRVSEAESYFKRGINAARLESIEYYQIVNNYWCVLLNQGKLQESLELIPSAVNDKVFPIGSRLSQYSTLMLLDRKPEALEVLKGLFKFAPFDRTVFAIGPNIFAS